jgi:hypothetical protein
MSKSSKPRRRKRQLKAPKLESGRLKWMRWTGFTFAAVLAVSAYFSYAPAGSGDPRQDNCSFGEVSNDKYQSFVSAAAAKVKSNDWPPITMFPWLRPAGDVFTLKTIEQSFSQRILEILPLASTDDERLAAIHAVMRVSGARYDPRGGRPGRYSLSGDVQFIPLMSYRIDRRDLRNYFPLNRWVGLNLLVDKSPIRLREVQFGLTAGWSWPSRDWRFLYIEIPPPSGLCPPALSNRGA